MPDPKRCLSHCNRCNHSTKHDVLHELRIDDEHVDEDSGRHEEWTNCYTLMQCRGCDDVSLKIDHWHSAYGQIDPEIYPPRTSRSFPSWLWDLPNGWRSLLQEIYGALHADSRRLAMMGARSVIDLYLTEAVGNAGTFEQRLGQLVSSGQLAPDDKTTLKAALEAGNAAAHRGHNPHTQDLSTVMDIVEHLLHGFVLKQSALSLQKSTPRRPSK